MYVIYINDRPLTLRAKTLPGTRGRAPDARHLVARYNGKPRTLLNYVDMLEKGSPKVNSVEIIGDDPEVLWQDFRGHHKWVAAAGGLVRNVNTGKHLFIFRRGSWDLPKGKIDAGEEAPAAALREVMEETGVTDLRLEEPLSVTYHTYRSRKGKRILKPTYWFAMRTATEQLIPETEEDIELAEWRTIREVLQSTDPLYRSLRAFLQDRS